MVAPYIPPSLNIGNWQLQDGTNCGAADSNMIEQYVAETLNIAGAPINVFKLLGIHEQGILIDLTGSGYPLSSGTAAGSNISNAFDVNLSTWQSVQEGDAVTSVPAFIGYNFGTKKLANGREKYNPPAPIIQHITTIKIKQSADPLNRASQIKVERSTDGINWIRVDIVNLPNTGNLETIPLKQSVPSTYWRIVPTLFAGVTSLTSHWEIEQLQLMNYQSTALDNIQDIFLQENRDRDYSQSSIQMKCYYQIMDSIGDLSKFGLDIMDQYTFSVSFAQMVEQLGRPIVIGDIIEVAPELAYDQNLMPVKKYLEVTDCAWAAEGFTPNWRPTLYRFQAQKLMATQENRDLFGTFNNNFNVDDGSFFQKLSQVNTAAFSSSDVIHAKASDAVPETGEDATEQASTYINSNGDTVQLGPSQASSHASDFKAATAYDGRQVYVEDGLPSDGASYTEGFVLPDVTLATDLEYFRLNYPPNTKIQSRLYRFSALKNRWLFLEQDRRGEYSSHKPSVSAVLASATKKSIKDSIL